MNVMHLDVDNIKPLNEDSALILGTFDGVHIGHQLLIDEAKKVASNVAVMLIYTNKKITKAHQTSGVLTTLDDRVAIFNKSNVSDVYLLNLGEALMALTPSAFIEYVLAKTNANYIVIGEDFRFGKMASGTPLDLLNTTLFKTLVVKPLMIGPEKISTSLIKDYLMLGETKAATKLLGRYYGLGGLVTKGFGLGSKLGYPTANIALDPSYFLPRHGVYLVRITIANIKYFGMASLGFHPTVNEVKVPLLEVHIFNFNDNIYRQALSVEFLAYLRPERKFASVELLVTQIDEDAKLCQKLIKEGEF